MWVTTLAFWWRFNHLGFLGWAPTLTWLCVLCVYVCVTASRHYSRSTGALHAPDAFGAAGELWPAACPDLIQKQTAYACSSHLFILVMLFVFSSASIGLHALCLASITTISSHLQNVMTMWWLQQTATNVGTNTWCIHWWSELEELKEPFNFYSPLLSASYTIIPGLGTLQHYKLFLYLADLRRKWTFRNRKEESVSFLHLKLFAVSSSRFN